MERIGQGCQICTREVIGLCHACSRQLCAGCLRSCRCLISCEACSDKSFRSPALFLQKACKNCFRPPPSTRIMVFWDAVGSGQVQIEAVRNKLRHYLNQQCSLKVFKKTQPQGHEAVQQDLLYAIRREIKDALQAGYTRIIVVTKRAVSMILPGILPQFRQSRANLELTTPQLRDCWVLHPNFNTVTDLELLISALKLQAVNGVVLYRESAVGTMATEIRSIPPVLELAVRSGLLNRKEFRYPHKVIVTYSLVVRSLNSECLQWAVCALERNKIVPYLWRIEDILKTVYDLHVNEDDILALATTLQETGGLQIEPQEPYIIKTPGKVTIPPSPVPSRQVLNILNAQLTPPSGAYLAMFYYSWAEQMKGGFQVNYIYNEQEKTLGLIQVPQHKEFLTLERLDELRAHAEDIRLNLPGISEKDLELKLKELYDYCQIDPQRLGFNSFQDLLKDNHPDSEDEDGECIICSDPLEPCFVQLDCTHQYHSKCLLKFYNAAKVEPKCVICDRRLEPHELRLLGSDEETKETDLPQPSGNRQPARSSLMLPCLICMSYPCSCLHSPHR